MRMLATCRPARLKDFDGEVQVIVRAAASSLREAKGVVGQARQGQVGVDLISHDDDAVAGRHLVQGGELAPAPDPADRVVRVAQEQQARTGRLDGLLQGGQVTAIDAVGVTHEGDAATVRPLTSTTSRKG